VAEFILLAYLHPTVIIIASFHLKQAQHTAGHSFFQEKLIFRKKNRKIKHPSPVKWQPA